MSHDENESGFVSHLVELRKRLIHSFIFLIIFFIGCYFFAPPIQEPTFFNIIGKSFGPKTTIAIATTIKISNQPIVGMRFSLFCLSLDFRQKYF